jgi:hypothetical protein
MTLDDFLAELALLDGGRVPQPARLRSSRLTRLRRAFGVMEAYTTPT